MKQRNVEKMDSLYIFHSTVRVLWNFYIGDLILSIVMI